MLLFRSVTRTTMNGMPVVPHFDRPQPSVERFDQVVPISVRPPQTRGGWGTVNY